VLLLVLLLGTLLRYGVRYRQWTPHASKYLSFLVFHPASRPRGSWAPVGFGRTSMVLVVVGHEREVAILVVVVVSVVDVLRRALPAALRLEDGVDPGGVVVAL